MNKIKKYFIYGLLWCGLTLPTSWPQARTLSEDEMQIKDTVTQSQQQALQLLEQLVNINSGTMNFTGIKNLADIVAKELQQLGFATEWIPLDKTANRAGHLFAEREGNSGKRVLLLGHLDTVFNEDSPLQTFSRAGKLAYGPGVIDMKGGIVTIISALKALQTNGKLDNTNIIVALTGDEESTSEQVKLSRAPLITAAEKSDVALGFEFAYQLNEVVTGRRGIAYWQLVTTGKPGHSSKIFSPEFGHGAILETVRILSAFEQQLINDNHYGLTLNPGLIVGGTEAEINTATNTGQAFGKRNVIAQRAVTDGEIRFISTQQCAAVKDIMRTIVANTTATTTANITFGACKPAMETNKDSQLLLAQLSEINEALGYGPITASDPTTRGAADISYIAALIPSLDGLGPAGSGAHTVEENIQIDTLTIATQRAAILIDRLTHSSR